MQTSRFSFRRRKEIRDVCTQATKIGSKVIKTTKNAIKWAKELRNTTIKLLFNFKIREIEILKNMPVKKWLPWKRQVTWTVTFDCRLNCNNSRWLLCWLPDKYIKFWIANVLPPDRVSAVVFFPDVRYAVGSGQYPLRSYQGPPAELSPLSVTSLVHQHRLPRPRIRRGNGPTHDACMGSTSTGLHGYEYKPKGLTLSHSERNFN